MMSPQSFHVDWPPTANLMWRHSRGQNYLSARYKQWKKDAGWQLKAQHARSIVGPVSITILLCKPTKQAIDLDNRVKPLLDLLVNCGVIEDDNDSVIHEIHVKKGEGFQGAKITVTPLSAAVEEAS